MTPSPLWDSLDSKARAAVDSDFARIDFPRLKSRMTRSRVSIVRLGHWGTCSLLARLVNGEVAVELSADAEGQKIADWPRSDWDLEYVTISRALPCELEPDRFFQLVRLLAKIPDEVQPVVDGDSQELSHGAVMGRALDSSDHDGRYYWASISGLSPTASLSFTASGHRRGLNWLELSCTHEEAPALRAAIARAFDTFVSAEQWGGLCPPAAWEERARQASLGSFITQSDAEYFLDAGVIDDHGFATSFKRVPIGPLPECLDLRGFALSRAAPSGGARLELATIVPVLFGVPLPAPVEERKSQIYRSEEVGRRSEVGPWVLQESNGGRRSDCELVELQVQQGGRGPFAIFAKLEIFANGFGKGILCLVGERAGTLEVEQKLSTFLHANGWMLTLQPKRVALP